ASARNDNELPGDHPKPSAKDKGPIGEARQHQEEVENTLNNLLKLLEPWGSINEVKGEAKAVLDEQRRLGEQTKDLAKQDTLGQQRDALTPDQKAALDQAAELQGRLGERTQQLLEKMTRFAQDQQAKD